MTLAEFQPYVEAALNTVEWETARLCYPGQMVTADMVPVLPIRSIPLDLITEAVARRLYRIPAGFSIIQIHGEPDPQVVAQVVAELAARWTSPNGGAQEESVH